MFFYFTQNMTYIISYVFLSMKLEEVVLERDHEKWYKILAPLAVGILSVIVMLSPYKYQGMYFDLRLVPIFFIAYTQGLGTGLLATIIPALYRLYLGGSVAWAGVVLGLVLPAIIGGFFKQAFREESPYQVIHVKRIISIFLVMEICRMPFLKIILQLPIGFILRISFSFLLFSSISILSMVMIINQAKENKLKERELMAGEEQYRYLIETSPQPMLIYKQNAIVYANKAVVEMARGESDEELIGHSIFQFIAECDHQVAEEGSKWILENLAPESSRLELKLKTVDGDILDVEARSKGILYMSQPAILVTLIDITEQKKEKEEISQKAFHDALTGLPNRYLLTDYFERAIHRSSRKDRTVSIMFIDLDRFKLINDTLGHEIGDLVLKQSAQRISDSVRGSDIVFRHGGDEFIVLLEEITNGDVSKVAQRVIDAFAAPFMVEGSEIYTSPSIGISLYPTDGVDIENLIKNADLAMYHAKDQGRNNFQFYTYNEKINRKMRLEVDLRKALDRNQFLLYYQPQVDFTEERIVGVEALLRWNHPQLGMVRPGEFISLLEETGYIVPIGYWVIEQACWQNVHWQKMGFLPVPVVVNISLRQLRHQEFVETIREILQKTGLDPEYLELEMMESMIQNKSEVVTVLQDLKAMGVKITIDNFGTGYSVLSIFKQVSFDNLKIDHSFVNDIVTNPNTGTIVKAIIELGRTLNFNVIAAGIEGVEQIDFLRANRCNLGQGYYFSKPMPGEQIEEIFKTKSEELNHI